MADHEEARAVVAAAKSSLEESVQDRGEIKSAILSWAWRAVKEARWGCRLVLFSFLNGGVNHNFF